MVVHYGHSLEPTVIPHYLESQACINGVIMSLILLYRIQNYQINAVKKFRLPGKGEIIIFYIGFSKIYITIAMDVLKCFWYSSAQ